MARRCTSIMRPLGRPEGVARAGSVRDDQEPRAAAAWPPARRRRRAHGGYAYARHLETIVSWIPGAGSRRTPTRGGAELRAAYARYLLDRLTAASTVPRRSGTWRLSNLRLRDCARRAARGTGRAHQRRRDPVVRGRRLFSTRGSSSTPRGCSRSIHRSTWRRSARASRRFRGVRGRPRRGTDWRDAAARALSLAGLAAQHRDSDVARAHRTTHDPAAALDRLLETMVRHGNRL